MLKKKWVYVIVAIVALAALVTGGAVYFYSSNNYVAKVAGEKISKAEYNFFLNSTKSEMERAANIADENARKAFWSSKPEGGKSAEEIAKDKALESAKEFKIQLIKAKQSKVALDKQELDGINLDIQNMVKQSGGKLEVEQTLKQTYGVNLEQYKAFYKDYMLVTKFISGEQKKIQPTDEEIKNYYNNNKDKVDKVTVHHILFKTVDNDMKPLPEDKQKEAEKNAKDILDRAKKGEDFVSLAKQYSEDEGSKSNGGEYTFQKNGQMVPEFEDWAFKAKPGDIDIVKTSYGYHVIKLDKRTTFEEVKDSAKAGVQSSKYAEKLDEWKKDPQFNLEKNEKVLNSIKVV